MKFRGARLPHRKGGRVASEVWSEPPAFSIVLVDGKPGAGQLSAYPGIVGIFWKLCIA